MLLKEVKMNKKSLILKELEKKGGQDYHFYEYEHLTIVKGLEPKRKNKREMGIHININSKKRYGVTKEEIQMVIDELFPKGKAYKIEKSFFMKTCVHVYEV